MERVRSNLDVVRRVYALTGDYLNGETEEVERALPHLIASEATLIASSALPSGSVGPYSGPAGLLEWLEGVRAQWSTFELHLDELFEAAPDTVVMLGRNIASRDGGRGYAVTVGHVWRLRNSKVVGATAFQSHARALEHAGIARGTG